MVHRSHDGRLGPLVMRPPRQHSDLDGVPNARGTETGRMRADIGHSSRVRCLLRTMTVRCQSIQAGNCILGVGPRGVSFPRAKPTSLWLKGVSGHHD